MMIFGYKDTNRIAHPNFGKRMYAYVDKCDSIVRLTPFLANDGQTFKSRFVSNAYVLALCHNKDSQLNLLDSTTMRKIEYKRSITWPPEAANVLK